MSIAPLDFTAMAILVESPTPAPETAPEELPGLASTAAMILDPTVVPEISEPTLTDVPELTSNSLELAEALKHARARQLTVSFERPVGLRSKKAKSWVPVIAIAFLGYLALDTLFPDEPDLPPLRSAIIRPKLPDARPHDPQKSQKIYMQALVPYLKDTMQDYRDAAELFRLAALWIPQT